MVNLEFVRPSSALILLFRFCSFLRIMDYADHLLSSGYFQEDCYALRVVA